MQGKVILPMPNQQKPTAHAVTYYHGRLLVSMHIERKNDPSGPSRVEGSAFSPEKQRESRMVGRAKGRPFAPERVFSINGK
jgi:hypothetical protein